tara:strand:+ start:4268 stop:4504 length:237 start_codon:yes stop_codon:yes gene_type:complete
MKRVEKLNKWSKLSDKEKSDKIVNELDWTDEDQENWVKFKKKLPQLLREGVIFGIFATTFLTGIAIALYHLLSHIKSF